MSVLEVGTVICDNEYKEDIGLVVEIGCPGDTGDGWYHYRVWSVYGNALQWFGRHYVEGECTVLGKKRIINKERRKSPTVEQQES